MNRSIKKYQSKRYDKYERQGDIHWKLYHNKLNNYYKKVVDNSLKPFDITERGTVLDIGCGDGLLTYLLREKGFEMIGIDDNMAGIEIAKEKNKGVKFYCERIEDFIKRRFYFDYMLCVDVIEHLENPQIIVDMMKYVNKFMVLVTDNDLYSNSPSVYHTQQFIPEEIEYLFKNYKLEKISMDIQRFFGYKIYDRKK